MPKVSSTTGHLVLVEEEEEGEEEEEEEEEGEEEGGGRGGERKLYSQKARKLTNITTRVKVGYKKSLSLFQHH